MVLLEKTIIVGSFWNYINEIYTRAGFSDKIETVSRSKKRVQEIARLINNLIQDHHPFNPKILRILIQTI
jgi:hypothetical protein